MESYKMESKQTKQTKWTMLCSIFWFLCLRLTNYRKKIYINN